MFERLLDIIADLGNWSYFIIFSAVFLESAAFVGVIVPGETAVVISGILASQDYLKLTDCLWITCLGAILGDTVGYSVGRFFGNWYFGRHKRFLFIKRSHVAQSEEYFRQHGGKTVFLGRFISFFRAFAPFTAGMSRMHYGWFAFYNVSGGIVWAISFTLIGYFFGASWHLIEKWTGRAGIFVLFLCVVAAGFYHLYRTLSRSENKLRLWALEKYDAFLSSSLVTRFVERHPKAIAFVGERLSPRSYLGLHLTVGFFLSLAFVWLFGGIVQDVFAGDPLVQVDRWISVHVRYFEAPVVTRIITAFSALSAAPAIVVGSLAAIAYFFHKRRPDYIWAILAAVLGGGLLTMVLKLIIHTIGPVEVPLSPLGAHRWAFPSGYASLAIVFYGMITYFIVRQPLSWRLRAFFVTAAIFIAFLIGFCRIYLEYSYLSGILSGYVGGLFWLTICITGFEVYRKKKAGKATENT